MACSGTVVQLQHRQVVVDAANSVHEDAGPHAGEAVGKSSVLAGAAKRRSKGKRAAAKFPSADKEVPASLDLPQPQILAAVSSLYADGLRPYGRLIRKRLAEHASVQHRIFDVTVGLGILRSTCEACAGVKVETEKGGEWAALLDSRPDTFVDYLGTRDVFPASMWFVFKSYLASLDGEAALFPPGRYDCARTLIDRKLPFLSGRSLGQVCHIIELSMSQRKLLGYIDAAITPYARSQTKVKDEAAEGLVGDGTEHFPVASWETVRSNLSTILSSATKKGKKNVPLSTLKRLFRSRFRSELSETALGYTRISNMLEDPQVSDICSVRLLKSGYVLVPRSMSRTSTDTSTISGGAVSTASTESFSCEDCSVRSKWSSCSSRALTTNGELRKFVHDAVARTALSTFDQDSEPSSQCDQDFPAEGDCEITPRRRTIRPLLGSVLAPGLGSVHELSESDAIDLDRSGDNAAFALGRTLTICESMPKLMVDRAPSFDGPGVLQKSAVPSPLLTRSPRYDWLPHRAERMASMPELHVLDQIVLDTPRGNEGSAALRTFTPGLRTFTPRESALRTFTPCESTSGACDPESRFTFNFGHVCPVDACSIEAQCRPASTVAARSVSLEDEVLLSKGFGHRLAMPSPAVTASNWGTPRTPCATPGLRQTVCLADLL